MAKDKVDVIIIGSGHSGGMAAKVLTEKGISCLMLNAGPIMDVHKDAEPRAAYSLPFRGFKEPGRLPHVFQATGFNANVWVDEREVPYTFNSEHPYNWVRVRLFGGRSLFWSRQSYRLSDYELKGKSHDGFGDDWPISLADLAPYYSRVEEIFRVSGHAYGLPQYPDGNFISDNTPWCGSIQRIISAGRQLNIPVCKIRSSQGVNGLASSINLLLPDAFATGKLTAIPNVVVRELRTDKNTGLINEVHFVDRISRREMSACARVVVLAAGTLESTRLLLNSRLANSSGVMGHYLVDQVYGPSIICSVPEARDGRATPEMMQGIGILPRFKNLGTRESRFIRGYALTLQSNHAQAMDPRSFATYGADLRRKLNSYHGSFFRVAMMGEVLAHFKNHVRIDEQVKDAWGIPVLHIETEYGANETNMAVDAIDTGLALVDAAGFEVLVKNYKPNPPGYSVHELGTCRMGNDPKTSVLNKWNQSHDIKNLFVVDGSSFVSSGWQNPTMTIVALAMRSSEYLAEQMRLGHV